MADAGRKKKSTQSDLFVVNVPSRKHWFLNGDLIKIHHINRAAGIVTFYNFVKERMESTSVVEFRKKRQKAFKTKEVARMLNFHQKSLPRLAKLGLIPEPIGVYQGGSRSFHRMSWYSEDHVREARRLMAQVHHGKARKDGLVTNNKVPTEQELTYMMGGGTILYARNINGEFVPVYSETL